MSKFMKYVKPEYVAMLSMAIIILAVMPYDWVWFNAAYIWPTHMVLMAILIMASVMVSIAAIIWGMLCFLGLAIQRYANR